MAALTLEAALLELSKCQSPDLEDAPWKLVFAGLGYFAAIGLANVIYSLAPRVESRIRPERVAIFRKLAFGLGFSISLALPFVTLRAFFGGCPK